MKKQLREQLKAARAKIPRAKQELWNKQIFENLQAWECYRSAKRVMLYLSIGWEINTWPLVEDLEKRKIEIYVPVVQKNPRALRPTAYPGKENLVPADFGILEPGPAAPVIGPGELDLVLVPGLAFTSEGYRIGFGGGFYDRFLPAVAGVKVGLCYTAFIRDLPVDEWDMPVDFLATEEGIRGRKLPE